MTLVSDARAIFRQAVRAVDPARAVRRSVRRTRRGVLVGDRPLGTGPRGRVAVVAVGKAAAAMADAAYRELGRTTIGIVATPRGYPTPNSPLRAVVGDHPFPRVGSFRAGAAVLRFVQDLRSEDAVVFLLSGGSSATVEVPLPPLRPADLERTTRVLLASGAPIGSMNAIRRHLSAIKGGRLAVASRAGTFGTLALSDVVGDRPADIGSGPSVGDPSTFRTALENVHRYRIASELPPSVVRFLRAGAAGATPDTPKPADARLARAPFVLVGSNRLALAAASAEAERRGYRARVLTSRLVGETRAASLRFARRLRAQRRGNRGGSVALLAGGETTVTLGPRPGFGGRNLEFALGAAEALAGLPAAVLSGGTDGIDGPTDVAGGWVDGRSAGRAERSGIDLDAALARHASYAAVERIGGLLRTGPTGTNVMDVHVGLITREPGAGRSREVSGTEGSSPPGAAPSSRRRPT